MPHLIEALPELVEYIEVIPDRLWYDFGDPRTPGGRFQRVHRAIEILKRCAEGRQIAGHGIGLSLPSDMPIDSELLDEVASVHRELGFAWYSEHISMFLTPHGSVPNAQAGLGLPVAFDEEILDILKEKLRGLREALGCPLLMENSAQFTPVPDPDMSEPEFLNRLHAEAGCGILLDLHNLYVNERNGVVRADDYLAALDPEAVEEIHLAGGDELAGFYTDSHSNLTPADVWSWAYRFVPRFPNLRAIVFEFHESYFPRLGVTGIAEELSRLRELAAIAGTGASNTGTPDEGARRNHAE